ncbi:hypothetical protein [uncultured Arcticibacterium sp.]|uniref:hypothetical protein n=1 Tax=uncultured Arcticibacterium sp. TaxID=2173042 RepID=UPI0030F7BA6E
MDLQTSKIELVKEILNIENPSLIQRVYDLLKSEKEEVGFHLTEVEKKEIQIGLEQLDKGMRVPAREFLKKFS